MYKELFKRRLERLVSFIRHLYFLLGLRSETKSFIGHLCRGKCTELGNSWNDYR